jgi:hypothetical protein
LRSSHNRACIFSAATPLRCLASRQPPFLQKKSVLAKASTVFALFLVVTSSSYQQEIYHNQLRPILINDASNEGYFSPFAFEYDVNPVVHRPYLQFPEHAATVGQDRDVSGSYPPAPGGSLGLDVTQNIDVISSTPSTPLASPNDPSTSWLETPVTSLSMNTSPSSAVAGSFTQREGSTLTCCHCQELFYRRCDLK